MRKFLLLSIVFATMAIPLITAHERNGRRALKKTMFLLIVVSLAYFLAIRFFYSRLS